MGLDIGSTTIGISRTGAEKFKSDLHANAIEETKALVAKVEPIKDACEAGWQGVSEENFMKNLYNTVEVVQSALDELGEALNNELDQIVDTFEASDEEMIQVEG